MDDMNNLTIKACDELVGGTLPGIRYVPGVVKAFEHWSENVDI
jgi:hypothetical protein